MRKIGLLLSLLLTSALSFADDPMQTQVLGPFGTLNTNSAPQAIGANQSPDLLNVDITDGGKSVKKREGYLLDNTFTTSTSSVHGAYKFFDANGNEVRLWGQDNGLWGSVAGATYVRVATGTLNATWQCTDYLGFAYCVTSARDTPVKTNGATSGTTYQGSIPAGTLIASTPERLLVGNTAASPSRLFYSGASNLTDFTVGSQPSSSSYEDITSPGAGLSHISYRYGKWLWWKDQSFGFIVGTDQTNLQIVTISNTVGTLDNTDVWDEQLTYFRGNDSHFYAFDGSNLNRISRDITPTVLLANRRKAASWSQSTQADFGTGAVTFNGPSPSLSTAAVSGSIVPGSSTLVDTDSTTFFLGSGINVNISTFSIKISTNNSGTITDPSFEGTLSNNFLVSVPPTPVFDTAETYSGCTLSPQAGSQFMRAGRAGNSGVNECNTTYGVKIVDLNGTVLDTKQATASNNSCAWSSTTLTSEGNIGKRVQFVFFQRSDNCLPGSFLEVYMSTATTTASYIFGGSISYYSSCNNGTVGTQISCNFDNVSSGSSTVTTGSYTSRIFDTAFSTSLAQAQASWTLDSSTPIFVVLQATTTSGPWTSIMTSTGSNAQVNRYLRYVSSFSVSSRENANTTLNDVTLISKSTGTYYSSVNSAPSLTSWSDFGVNDSIVNGGTITYFVRASTNSFSVRSTTPTWVQQLRNATITTSTGTFFQMRADFYIFTATDTPRIDDFTFNWFEGTASDKMYGTYFNYAVWFSVSLGSTTSTNNRILRYDLINQGWTIYDITANGFLSYNNSLYIGDATVGRSYRFGTVSSDNNVAINSYWKSKDFFNISPFVDEDIRTMSWFCAKSSGTTLGVTYQVNQSTSTSYNINLYDAKSNIIRHNRNMVQGTLANTFNIKIGDNSTNPAWECFAGAYTYVPKSWAVYP